MQVGEHRAACSALFVFMQFVRVTFSSVWKYVLNNAVSRL